MNIHHHHIKSKKKDNSTHSPFCDLRASFILFFHSRSVYFWCFPTYNYFQISPTTLLEFDVVQCVPTRKGHQILYKGYTYVFKSEEIPEWVSIYFAPIENKSSMKCNLCELEIDTDAKSPILFEHMKFNHKDIYDLHKDNAEATVGFRVEFLHLNALKEGEGDTKPVFLSEVCEPVVETEVQDAPQEPEQDGVISMQYVMLDTKRKYTRKSTASTTGSERKRSWIWKYFDKLSNIIYRCNVCNVVLSIKGCNTNNLNRHMRSRHPESYHAEKAKELAAKQEPDATLLELMPADSDAPHAVITEEIYASNRDSGNIDTPSQKLRRSWIWSYFDHVSDTQAQCKLCKRQINHGGNATGNMNRHLKMIHHKTSSDNKWVWKVFEKEEDCYTCKICQQQLPRKNSDSDMDVILIHLKKEHGVISGDQIITGTECI